MYLTQTTYGGRYHRKFSKGKVFYRDSLSNYNMCYPIDCLTLDSDEWEQKSLYCFCRTSPTVYFVSIHWSFTSKTNFTPKRVLISDDPSTYKREIISSTFPNQFTKGNVTECTRSFIVTLYYNIINNRSNKSTYLYKSLWPLNWYFWIGIAHFTRS